MCSGDAQKVAFARVSMARRVALGRPTGWPHGLSRVAPGGINLIARVPGLH
jgi:hypothetical protein